MRKLEHIGAIKVDQSKQSITRRVEWKRGPWEKNYDQERGNNLNDVTRNAEETRVDDEKSSDRDEV